MFIYDKNEGGVDVRRIENKPVSYTHLDVYKRQELLRMGKGEYDLSAMFIVHNTYLDRADKAVRTHGDVSFSKGGSFYDVIYGMKTFGLVPEEEMRPGVMSVSYTHLDVYKRQEYEPFCPIPNSNSP